VNLFLPHVDPRTLTVMSTDEKAHSMSRSLRVNPIACEAHGMCVELLPELITADPWGYPIIAPGPVPGQLLPLARRAVAACPTLALLLSQDR
jgi:ferredoxin